MAERKRKLAVGRGEEIIRRKTVFERKESRKM